MSAPVCRISHAPLSQISVQWLLAGLYADSELPPPLKELDDALGGTLTRLRERGDLTGKSGELTLLPDVPGVASERLLLVGLGNRETLTLTRWEQALLTAVRKASAKPEATLAIVMTAETMDRLGPAAAAELAVCSAIVGSSPAGLYKAEKERHPFQEVTLCVPRETPQLTAAVERGLVLGNATNLTRELVNRHPEEIYPETFAARAAQEAASVGLQTEVFDLQRLRDERMNALLAVARGSAHEPRVVRLSWSGGAAGAPWLALCGKGVTFDSGGLSLKPSAGMLGMKADMAGAATVCGALTAIARLQLPVNVVGYMGLVENMVGPHSYKLGEVLTARNGVTIEVQNTDAEGRLVLADVLSYAADERPARIVDLATLTGSCMVALGEDVAGAFSNDQPWCEEVLAAAARVGEELWQMPMFESYADQLKCDFADIRNIGGKWGGAITAAKFLERFVEDIPWVHLDIAGPSFVESPKPHRDMGATGACLRTLVELAGSWTQS